MSCHVIYFTFIQYVTQFSTSFLFYISICYFVLNCIPRLPPKGENSPSGSSSSSQSSERSSPLSVQEKRERNRRHLNEITAATLPPLYHNPAQLLSLDESAILLKEQTKKQQVNRAELCKYLLF